MKTLNRSYLDEIITVSRISKRGRAPTPLHDDFYTGPQLLVNAMQPGSYMRPHRHENAEEIYQWLQGELMLIYFHDDGTVNEYHHLFPSKEIIVEIPRQIYHTAIALETDSVFLNIKQGPHIPMNAKDFPSWAPEEGTEEGKVYLHLLKKTCGDR